MYRCINGWTKLDMIAHVLSEFKGYAEGLIAGQTWAGGSKVCVYLTDDGKKCAVGLFIPDDHRGQKFNGDIYELLEEYPELRSHLPLPPGEMKELQKVHDSNWSLHSLRDDMTLASIITWIQDNVKGSEGERND